LNERAGSVGALHRGTDGVLSPAARLPRCCGVLVPKDQLSSALRDIASMFPVSPLDNALFKAFDPATTGSGIAGTDLLILAIWGADGLLVALWRFKWSPQST
jgi:hypothetical protein